MNLQNKVLGGYVFFNRAYKLYPKSVIRNFREQCVRG